MDGNTATYGNTRPSTAPGPGPGPGPGIRGTRALSAHGKPGQTTTTTTKPSPSVPITSPVNIIKTIDYLIITALGERYTSTTDTHLFYLIAFDKEGALEKPKNGQGGGGVFSSFLKLVGLQKKTATATIVPQPLTQIPQQPQYYYNPMPYQPPPPAARPAWVVSDPQYIAPPPNPDYTPATHVQSHYVQTTIPTQVTLFHSTSEATAGTLQRMQQNIGVNKAYARLAPLLNPPRMAPIAATRLQPQLPGAVLYERDDQPKPQAHNAVHHPPLPPFRYKEVPKPAPTELKDLPFEVKALVQSHLMSSIETAILEFANDIIADENVKKQVEIIDMVVNLVNMQNVNKEFNEAFKFAKIMRAANTKDDNIQLYKDTIRCCKEAEDALDIMQAIDTTDTYDGLLYSGSNKHRAWEECRNKLVASLRDLHTNFVRIVTPTTTNAREAGVISLINEFTATMDKAPLPLTKDLDWYNTQQQSSMVIMVSVKDIVDELLLDAERTKEQTDDVMHAAMRVLKLQDVMHRVCNVHEDIRTFCNLLELKGNKALWQLHRVDTKVTLQFNVQPPPVSISSETMFVHIAIKMNEISFEDGERITYPSGIEHTNIYKVIPGKIAKLTVGEEASFYETYTQLMETRMPTETPTTETPRTILTKHLTQKPISTRVNSWGITDHYWKIYYEKMNDQDQLESAYGTEMMAAYTQISHKIKELQGTKDQINDDLATMLLLGGKPKTVHVLGRQRRVYYPKKGQPYVKVKGERVELLKAARPRRRL